jgi:uncharacterized membrane protein YfcA
MSDAIQLVVLSLLGFAIGFVGGMVGLVLGVVRFPLILSAEISASMAAGTNLSVSTLAASAAAIKHLRQNNMHLRVFVIMAATGAAGAFIGSLLTRHLPVAALLSVIGVIVSYEAHVLIKSSRKQDSDALSGKCASSLIEGLIGFGIGFLGGLVGLVLGSIRLPAMISVLKMDPKVAVGTNLAAASVMGAAGLAGHLLNNDVDYLVLAAMGPAAMAGGYIGARYTNRFNARTLKMLIGIVLILVAIMMFLRAFVIQ